MDWELCLCGPKNDWQGGMRMKKINICCMMCMLMLGIGGCSWKQNQDMAGIQVFFAMDTYMAFTAYGADAEPAHHLLRKTK